VRGDETTGRFAGEDRIPPSLKLRRDKRDRRRDRC